MNNFPIWSSDREWFLSLEGLCDSALGGSADGVVRAHLSAKTLSTILLDHVGHIVFLRPQKKMIRIDTHGVVAAVQNVKVAIERPVRKFVGKAMGAILLMASDSNSAVSGIGHTSRPYPTSRSLLNFLPELV